MRSAMPHVTIILLLGAVCAILMGFSGCKKTTRTPPVTAPSEKSTPEAPADFTGEFSGGYKFVAPLANDRVWSMEAQSGTVSTEHGKHIFTLSTVRCRIYEHGKESLSLSAKTAKAEQDGKTVRARLFGNVRASAKQSTRTLRTSTLRWDSTENVIHVAKFVLGGDGMTLRADRGSLMTDFSAATFSGHVRMEKTGAQR